MDIVSLKDLPIPIAVVAICFYFLNQNNTEFAKRIATMVEQFTKEYKELLDTVLEERRQWNAVRVEENRQLMTIAQASTEAQTRTASEIHTLRNYIQPLVLSVQEARKRGAKSAGGDAGGTD